MTKRKLLILVAALCAATGIATARELEESPAPFSLTPVRPDTVGTLLGATVTVPAIAGVPVTNATIGAAAGIAAPAGGVSGVAAVGTIAGPIIAPMAPGVATVAAPPGLPITAGPAVGSALASFNGYYYPSSSVLVSYTSDLLANTDGKVFMHPSLPNHLMYYNSNEGRWCYQDARSMSGWFFVPREIFIAPPR